MGPAQASISREDSPRTGPVGLACQPRPGIRVFEQQTPLHIGGALREPPTFVGKSFVGCRVLHPLALNTPLRSNLESKLMVPRCQLSEVCDTGRNLRKANLRV